MPEMGFRTGSPAKVCSVVIFAQPGTNIFHWSDIRVVLIGDLCSYMRCN
jgi:hypothetical protein